MIFTPAALPAGGALGVRNLGNVLDPRRIARGSPAPPSYRFFLGPFRNFGFIVFFPGFTFDFTS